MKAFSFAISHLLKSNACYFETQSNFPDIQKSNTCSRSIFTTDILGDSVQYPLFSPLLVVSR